VTGPPVTGPPVTAQPRSAQPRSALRERVEFGPITVDFDARVLRPRPWTLVQSEWAAELAATDLATRSGPILELCAGAGQIGLAAAVLSDRDLVQVERDPVAAMFAAHNAALAGHARRTEVRITSIEDALDDDDRYVLIIADPPYLPASETGDWPEDPLAAIDGGEDGLTVIRACLLVGARHLDDGGQLLLQVAGPAQATRVVDELPTGLVFRDVRVVDDRRAVLRVCRAAG
jgi:methylase of polypeptide subunit release factors